MRRAAGNETIVVERSGEPKVVIMSIEHFERLSKAMGNSDAEPDEIPEWRRKLDRASEMLARDLAGQRINWTRLITDMRDDRTRQLLENLEEGKRTKSEGSNGETRG